MATPTQTPPILTLHRHGRTYILRLFDLHDSRLAISIARSLPDAEGLLVVTPTDTKFFSFNDGGVPTRSGTPQRVAPDSIGSIPSTVEEAGTSSGEEDPQEAAQRLAETAGRDMSRQAADLGFAEELVSTQTEPEIVGKTEAGVQVVRRPKRGQADNAPNSTCNRCTGTGVVATLLEGGKAAQGACPVCKGTGVIRRYGAAPQRKR